MWPLEKVSCRSHLERRVYVDCGERLPCGVWIGEGTAKGNKLRETQIKRRGEVKTGYTL